MTIAFTLAALIVLAVAATMLTCALTRRLSEFRRRRAYEATERSLLALSEMNDALELQDPGSAGHALRVTMLSVLIAEQLSLSREEVDALRLAATYHDLGKLSVPNDVWLRNGELNADERAQVERHPVLGTAICSASKALGRSLAAIRHHHERIDGTGYPDGLEGDAIPLGARIIAVAETWDALTTPQPWRDPFPPEEALEELRLVAGTQLDPRVVEVFEKVARRDPWMFGLEPESLVG